MTVYRILRRIFDMKNEKNIDMKNEKNTGRKYKMLFTTYFDGCYMIDPQPNVSSTFQMGVCGLDYNCEKKELVVYLRRPGLLIGRGGKTIKELEEHLGCKVKVVEIDLCK